MSCGGSSVGEGVGLCVGRALMCPLVYRAHISLPIWVDRSHVCILARHMCTYLNACGSWCVLAERASGLNYCISRVCMCTGISRSLPRAMPPVYFPSIPVALAGREMGMSEKMDHTKQVTVLLP